MAAAAVDHYGVLELGQHASAQEVKKAYRALSRLYHPDKAALRDEVQQRECERRMVALNAAYQVLMSPRARQEYNLSQPQPSRNVKSDVAAATSSKRNGGAVPTGRRQESPTTAKTTWDDVEFEGGRCPTFCRTPRCEPPGVPEQGSGTSGSRPRPRYQLGAKYTQKSRQARRMDPSQYTMHVDGRSHEFEGDIPGHSSSPRPSVGVPETIRNNTRYASGATQPTTTTSGTKPPAGPRIASWLQRQMDLARDWEQAHCPETAEGEAYQWRKASDAWLRARDRRQQERQEEASACEATRDESNASTV
eukprot:TRINITY_DN16775_c0_g1_i2.p1 TRINITY_DN16775_c0_g1~~TRINITY_DN16775_c0_g1_i2.p1  ORF type:complete len:306 (-),score=39.29 TRINITY_DN16775_c0_g1_i2:74-991(-)